MHEFVHRAFVPLLWAHALTAVVVFAALLFVTAPYGRHVRSGFGPLVSARWGWLVMESVAALVPALMGWWVGQWTAYNAWFLVLWEVHYAYRAFVYPWLLRAPRPMPVTIPAMAVVYNGWNGWLLGAWFFFVAPEGPWPSVTAMICGAVLFGAGMAINRHADGVLLRLRRNRAGYAIPTGGLYRWVSMPAYLGEIVQWVGMALLFASPPLWVFAGFTAANLVPRALANHRWYKRQFPDYPPERRAVIPFLL